MMKAVLCDFDTKSTAVFSWIKAIHKPTSRTSNSCRSSTTNSSKLRISRHLMELVAVFQVTEV